MREVEAPCSEESLKSYLEFLINPVPFRCFLCMLLREKERNKRVESCRREQIVGFSTPCSQHLKPGAKNSFSCGHSLSR